MKHEPTTLGEKIARFETMKTQNALRFLTFKTFYLLFKFILLTAAIGLFLWWGLVRPELDAKDTLVLIATIIALCLAVGLLTHAFALLTKSDQVETPPLLANDRQGFMRALQLDAKTAIFDGSNIYHFGRDNGLDAVPLGLIADQLRDEGYRIVCFFDANIYFTLRNDGAFTKQRHSVELLLDIFGLATEEIYVVPSGVEADEYILETLKHLPVSFAVTNDLFRDRAEQYRTVLSSTLWRKGVAISNGEIKLLQHQLEFPMQLK